MRDELSRAIMRRGPHGRLAWALGFIGIFSVIQNWQPIATISAPIIALFVGIWANRRFEARASLISYFGHVSSFHVTAQDGTLTVVHTHAVVLRNVSRRRSATNVRLGHHFLPDFVVWPEVSHRIEDLPSGARDIVIPMLVPGEQITISYLYFPPRTVANINAGIKHDGGFAQQIPVLLQRRYPAWFNRLVGLVLLVGVIFILYLLYELAVWLL